MKKIIIILSLIAITACKNNSSTAQRTIVDADLTNHKVVHLTNKDEGYTTLEELVAQHKGKIIYIDVWASWCGPCKAMMPASAALQERYKDKDVAFLYISIDDSIAAWKSSANSFNLQNDESFLARNYPKAAFFQNNNVSSIPRYFLYDRTGRLLDDNAMPPASKDLVNTIDFLLAN